jgi:hypothetical protein
MLKKEIILEGLDCANCAAKIEDGVHANISDRKLSSTHPGNYPLFGLTGSLCRHAGSA